MNWYKLAQENIEIPENTQPQLPTQKVPDPQEERTKRKDDVLNLLNSLNDPIAANDIVLKLTHITPERWTIYWKLSRVMAQHVMRAINDIKASGVQLSVKDNYRMPRAKRGGMGKAQHYNTYQISK